jgi:hypothetical protein
MDQCRETQTSWIGFASQQGEAILKSYGTAFRDSSERDQTRRN